MYMYMYIYVYICIMCWVRLFVEYADGYAARACEVCFRQNCMVVEQVEHVVFWFFYLKDGWTIAAALRPPKGFNQWLVCKSLI